MTTRTAPPDTDSTPLTRHPWLVWVAMAAALVGELFDALDALVTSVAGPTIQRELGGSATFMQWLAAGYTIAMAAGLLIGGRLGDRFGRKRMFLIGMVGFSSMSLLAGLATTPGLLLAARVLQGLLGALMVPQTLGIFTEIFPAERLGQAFALMGPVMAGAGLAGPIVSGWIIDADLFGQGWRMLFWVNLPFCLAAVGLGAWLLPRSRPNREVGVDLIGSGLASSGLAGLIFALVEGRELGWPWWVFALIAGSLACLVGFVGVQRSRGRAGLSTLLEPSLFGNRAFTGGLVFGLAIFGVGMATGMFTALYAQLGLGMSPLRASLLTIPDMAGMMLGFLLIGKLGSDRRSMGIGVIGMLAGAVALLAVLAWVDPGVRVWAMLPALALTGAGSGMIMGPFFDVVMAGVSEAETGSASGALTALQQVGAATGVAVLGSVFFALNEHAPGLMGATRGMEVVLGISAVALVASGFALRLLPARVEP